MTAFPTVLLTMSPTRAGSEQASLDLTWSTRVEREARRPRRTAAVKSALRRMRWAAGSTGQAARRARPLRRRAERIERPARVRIRSRKPWVLARRRLLGWNVRLDTRGSEGWLGGKAGAAPAGQVRKSEVTQQQDTPAAPYGTTSGRGSVKPGRPPDGSSAVAAKLPSVSNLPLGVGETRRRTLATVAPSCGQPLDATRSAR